MLAAKVFENGRSQAWRLPKEYRFNGDEVMFDWNGGRWVHFFMHMTGWK